MPPAAGIVSTQAQTIWPATPHRTADQRRVAPTPTIAPVMVWVVVTGMPKWVAKPISDGRARLGAEAADRLQLGDPRAHRLDDPPAAGERAQGDRGVRRDSTQSGM